jgi:hypothetical protein
VDNVEISSHVLLSPTVIVLHEVYVDVLRIDLQSGRSEMQNVRGRK